MAELVRLLKTIANRELQYDALELDGEIKLARHCLALLDEDWTKEDTNG